MESNSYILRNLWAMTPGAVVALALFALVLPLRRLRLKRLGLVSEPWREVVLALFWAYCGALASLLLLPADFNLLTVLREGYSGPLFRRGTVSMELFRALRKSKLALMANVALLVPLGFCTPLLWRKQGWWSTLIIAVAVPILAENWQVLIGRTFDVDDLVLNALGVLLGRVLWDFFGDPKLHCEER